MMFRFTIITLLSLFLHGCAYLHSLNSDLPQQIDEWLTTQQYGKALNTLKYVSKTHKHYAKLMAKKHSILLQAREFEQEQQLKAQQLETKNQWYKANTVYMVALDKLPQSQLLTTEYQAFIKRRDKYLQNLEFKLSIRKGSWLLESTPIQKQILDTVPEDTSRQKRYQKTSRELQQTVDMLMSCTETAIQAGRISLAETCMQTVDRLNPPYMNKEKLKTFKAQLEKTHQQLLNKQNIKSQALLNELKQGYSHQNLQRTQRHLSEISEFKSQNRESEKLARELKKHIKTGLAQRMEAGRRQYSNGQIKKALSIWIPLKTIAPDNAKLNDYIARAKRVLKKLEKLSNSPPTIRLPQ